MRTSMVVLGVIYLLTFRSPLRSQDILNLKSDQLPLARADGNFQTFQARI